MTSVPRELLKWLQGLDLSYPVNNLKRDFSNGFLVAELFSRYYQQDVEMHSYDNGQSLDRKRDNWAQLSRFFHKKRIVIDRNLVNDVGEQRLSSLSRSPWRLLACAQPSSCLPSACLRAEYPCAYTDSFHLPLCAVHCKTNEAPVRLLMIMYSQLTGREVRSNLPPSSPGKKVAAEGVDSTTQPAPSYAKHSTSSLINARIRGSELSALYVDIEKQQERAQTLVDELRQSRAAEHSLRKSGLGGYASTSTQRVLHGLPKALSLEEEAPHVHFREVTVKAVDYSEIGQLLGSRDQNLQGGGNSGLPGLTSTGVASFG